VNQKEKQVFFKIAFAEYTKEKWQNCCSHVKKIEEEYWQRDGVMDEASNRQNDYSVGGGGGGELHYTCTSEISSSSEDE
jgi:hypothetical protein